MTLIWLLQMVQMSGTSIVWCCLSPHSKISLGQLLVKAGKVLSNEDDSMDKFTLLVFRLTQGVPLYTLLIPSLFGHKTQTLLL